MLQMISTILNFRKVIHSDRMYYTASIPVHILQCSDFRRITSIADVLGMRPPPQSKDNRTIHNA
jgi:hypothetical protein